jgi:hypothetical protein
VQAEPARLELTPLLAVQPRHGYTRDFLAPPPQSPLVTIDQELERVRSTPAEVVAVELGRSLAQREGGPPAALRALLAVLDPSVRFEGDTLAVGGRGEGPPRSGR